MRIFYALFTLFFFVVHPLFSQGTVRQGTVRQGTVRQGTVSQGPKSMGTASGRQGTQGLPVDGQQLPKNIEGIIEQEIKNHPEKKKDVDDLLHQLGLPDSTTMPLDDVKHIVIELLKNNDKRSQPVDPAQAGAIYG